MESIGSSYATICYFASTETRQCHQTFHATMAVKILQYLPLVVQTASRLAADCLHDDNR
jgi:hypothetical protein